MSTMQGGALGALFLPRSVAVIGASDDYTKIGGRPIGFNKISGYKGKIYPVNPNRETVQGLPAYRRVGDIKDDVDTCILAVPAPSVLPAIEECAAKGARLAVIFSAGFAEVSEDGRRQQERIAAIAREAGMRVLGPNCMGSANFPENFVCTFTTTGMNDAGTGWQPPGSISVAAQSGAIGVHMLAVAKNRGLGLAKWCTSGNSCDIEVSELIAYLARDPATRVIGAYLEGCRDRDKLVAALELARDAGKPVVMLKVGRSEQGAIAIASHTASLTGSDAAFDALFRQYGVFRAYSLEEFTDVIEGCDGGRFPSKPEIGLLTISGGIGVMMTDAATELGLSLPPMPEAIQVKMREMVPYAAPRNPVDPATAGIFDLSITGKYIEYMFDEGDYAIFVAYLSTMIFEPKQWAVIHPYLLKVRQRYPERPMILSVIAPPDYKRQLNADGFIVLDDPSRAVALAGALAKIAANRARAGTAVKPPSVPKGALPPPAAAAGEAEAKHILASAGIPIVAEKLVSSAADASAAARALGLPVALKIASKDIVHKSEIGGVLLGLADDDAVAKGYETLVARARKAMPRARIDGVLVAPMIADGVETILGVSIDPALGPVVMFGIGGIFVEVYQDVTYRLAPFGVDEAEAMIREVRGFALLDGARGRPKADIAALARALAALSAYAAAHADRIGSIDINPFVVRPAGKGAVAVDAAMVP